MKEDEIIYHPNYNLDEFEKKLLSTQKQASLINEMAQTEGWKLLKKILEKEIDMIAKAAIDPGFKSIKVYQEKVAIARAMKRILDVVEVVIKQGKGAKAKLDTLRKLNES